MAVVALSLSLALTAFYYIRYTLDLPALRRATLEAQVRDIVSALQTGRDPSTWFGYRRYPGNYGFQVFEESAGDHRHVVSTANPTLLPALPTREHEGTDLHEGFESTAASDERQSADRWLLTDRDQMANKVYWIEAVLVGDPAGRWRGVILGEMLDHVVIPVLSVVLLLTLAMFLTVRISLRPLSRIAEQAHSLADAVASGGPLSTLPSVGLAREFRDVIDALNVMLAKLDRSLRSQRQFTADAAHELRNPLAVLQLEAARLAPQAAAQRVQAEIKELAALVDRLLRFAQAEDAMAAECGRVSLARECRGVCEELAATAAANHQSLTFEEPESTKPIFGQAELIGSAVRNVVDNALKFSPANSVITVSVKDQGCVVVDDQGPGVPLAERDQLFERFWHSPRNEGGGSGIGLALARRIARLHGGDVTVTDAPGGGARFILAFRPPHRSLGAPRQVRVSAEL